MTDPSSNNPKTTITPFLSVRNSARAVEFYKSGFGATELLHIEGAHISILRCGHSSL
jgi:hypothetical protein